MIVPALRTALAWLKAQPWAKSAATTALEAEEARLEEVAFVLMAQMDRVLSRLGMDERIANEAYMVRIDHAYLLTAPVLAALLDRIEALEVRVDDDEFRGKFNGG